MITLFIICIIVFTVKLVCFAFKAAWGITKGVLFVIGIPTLLIVLFLARAAGKTRTLICREIQF